MPKKSAKIKRVPIKAARDLSRKYGRPVVVIFTLSEVEMQMTTYGRTIEDSAFAAESGNRLKKVLDWPDSLCHAQPSRVKRLVAEARRKGIEEGKQLALTELNARIHSACEATRTTEKSEGQ